MSQPTARRTFQRVAAALTCAAASLVCASSAAAAPQYHGLNVHMLWSTTTSQGVQTELDMSRDLGANVIRLDVGWASLETDGKGKLSQWYVDNLDTIMNGARDRGIKVLVTLGNTPCWASSAPDSLKQGCSGDWWNRGVTDYPPTNPQDYGDIARWLTARYGSELAALEVWNEPDPSQSFWTSSDPAGDYAKLLKAAYPAAKAGDSGVPVLAGALSGADVPFLKQLYADGIKGSYDGLSIHPYNEWRDPSDMWQDQWKEYTFLPGIQWVHQTQLDNGDNTPLWATEFGWSSCSGARVCVSESQQAAYTAKATQLIADLPYVKGYTIYDLRDEGGSSSTINDNYGLVDFDYSHKPAYAALKAAWTGDTPPVPLPSTGSGSSGGSQVQLTITQQGGYYYATGTAPSGSQVELKVQRCTKHCTTVKIGRGKRAVVRTNSHGHFKRRLGKVKRLRHTRVRARLIGRSTVVAARVR